MGERFEFDFDPRYLPFLGVLGVTPQTTYVELTDDRLTARFGPWRFATPIANIKGVYITGPYQWFKAIGARGSFADRGLTFGTTTRGGVCIVLRDPTPGIEPTGHFRHPGVTLTVKERKRFADALLARMSEVRPLRESDEAPVPTS